MTCFYELSILFVLCSLLRNTAAMQQELPAINAAALELLLWPFRPETVLGVDDIHLLPETPPAGAWPGCARH